LDKLEQLFVEYPASAYGSRAKTPRMEAITQAFHQENNCCENSVEECRTLVARYCSIMNKAEMNQDALLSYIKTQFGVEAKGTIEELRRIALLGPSA
jgi:hypothetical protein